MHNSSLLASLASDFGTAFLLSAQVLVRETAPAPTNRKLSIPNLLVGTGNALLAVTLAGTRMATMTTFVCAVGAELEADLPGASRNTDLCSCAKLRSHHSLSSFLDFVLDWGLSHLNVSIVHVFSYDNCVRFLTVVSLNTLGIKVVSILGFCAWPL